MWSKLDDALMDHRKIFAAGAALGRNGPGLALGVYALGLMWTNKHLTDGHLPATVVQSWTHVLHPIRVANALVESGLWEQSNGGYVIHDFHDHNLTAQSVKQKRAEDRKRKASRKS